MGSIQLSAPAISVLEKRYLRKDARGQVVESPEEMFRRVAGNIAEADRSYNHRASIEELAEIFFRMMASLDFLPNSPCLMNAGRELQQLAACFVLPIEDSLDAIFETVKQTALIHQSGGGTGFSFSHLRPKHDTVQSTGGVASGPTSFMRVFNMATEVIKQGGTRRGANMGVLRVDHPDIMEFITIKKSPDEMTNFNLSVGITKEFMEALEKDGEYNLINPRTKKKSDRLKAKEVFEAIVNAAWETGDPGVLFLDRINEANPTPQMGDIESTNPCGEVPLLPYEPCVLGSINLSHMVMEKNGSWEADFEKIRKTVRDAVHFLDNVIDMNQYPLPQIGEMARGNRKIGLGVMGLAHFFIRLGIPFHSPKALEVVRGLMSFIQHQARERSMELAEGRGVFPNFSGSIYSRNGMRLRNATLTTIAPTGTLSLIANCSSGIEPIFAIQYIRRALEGMEFQMTDSLFLELGEKEGFLSRDLMESLSEGANLRELANVPRHIQDLFVTAFEIPSIGHIKIQAAFQEYTDNAVSKTINFPKDAPRDEVKEAFLLAYREKCKGITIYRSGSKPTQVLACGTKQVC
ncbi:MAG: ribonucleoside-diphosphate reductase, adenosylcobalamin-dependent [Deltaproteobacteria bacterium RBG_13_47_9]|nr:MAG: ribonucleoside-diphosphate reductase, adenosylcobalamin-dependent [Deltaproteobacteria bacterium RBG_13_47_9]